MFESLVRRLSLLVAVAATLTFSVACATGGEEPSEEPAAQAAEPEASGSMMGLDPAILQDPGRPAEEVAQDADRRPLEVYAFFGIEPGMTVADLWPGGGYNTFLLSKGVGPQGHVYSALGFYNDFQEGAIGQQFRDRVAADGLANVTIVDEISEIPAGSLDVAISVRNYHDLYGFDYDAEATVAAIYAAVAPGGVVGIVDVATDHEGWDADAHRLNKQVVIDDFTAGGFELEDESDLLANPNDDYTSNGFTEGREKTDRYVLKFRKPAM